MSQFHLYFKRNWSYVMSCYMCGSSLTSYATYWWQTYFQNTMFARLFSSYYTVIWSFVTTIYFVHVIHEVDIDILPQNYNMRGHTIWKGKQVFGKGELNITNQKWIIVDWFIIQWTIDIWMQTLGPDIQKAFPFKCSVKTIIYPLIFFFSDLEHVFKKKLSQQD